MERRSLGCFPCSSEQRWAMGSIAAHPTCLVGWWIYIHKQAEPSDREGWLLSHGCDAFHGCAC